METKIRYDRGTQGTLVIDGNWVGQLSAPVMADSGDHYQARAGDYVIRWAVTDSWRAAVAAYREALRAATGEDGRLTSMPDPGILEDESLACDWDSFTVIDESGAVVALGIAANHEI